MKSSSSLVTRLVRGSALALGAWLSVKAITESLNKFSLDGKVVLITGGTRGLGLILARQLADEDASIVICGRSKEALQRASDDLSSRTDDYMAIPCDIADKHQIKEMVRQIKNEMGSVDVLINNAGIIQVGPRESMKEEDYKSAMKVHFWGPFHLMNEVLPDMIGNEAGRIVNIVSVGGKVSFPHLLPYNASKYALSGLSEGMASELRQYNVKVTTVYPGLMRTGSPRNIDVKGQHQKEYAWFKIADSLPFLSMDAEDAAHRIIEAMKKGTRTITLSVPAKLAVAAHGIAPGLTITIFDLINSLLPAKSDDETSRKGYESSSRLSDSVLTKKTDEAARKNLEE